jgi:uncharacterized protein (DUF2062 family)
MRIRIAIAIKKAADPAGLSARGENGDPLPCPADCVILAERRSASGRRTAADLLETARQARAIEATHLMLLGQWAPSLAADFRRLVKACRTYPQALIIGRRPPASRAGYRRGWLGRRGPRFWLKMQTGRHLDDPLCTLRIIPLAVVEHLKFRQGGAILDMEILVKTAWAGVPFQAVSLESDLSAREEHLPTWWEPAWRVLLNIHFSMRSVLPMPHRKLVPQSANASTVVSVWHPMRSLRTLLRENTSPGQLALAAAMGVFFGTLPLIACHSLVIILAANYFRLNKIAALSASQLCMPPLVPALCIEVGHLMRHGRFLTEISLETLGYQALERLYEWLLGALILAPFLAVAIGGTVLLMARLAARRMAAIRKLEPTPGRRVEP